MGNTVQNTVMSRHQYIRNMDWEEDLIEDDFGTSPYGTSPLDSEYYRSPPERHQTSISDLISKKLAPEVKKSPKQKPLSFYVDQVLEILGETKVSKNKIKQKLKELKQDVEATADFFLHESMDAEIGPFTLDLGAASKGSLITTIDTKPKSSKEKKKQQPKSIAAKSVLSLSTSGDGEDGESASSGSTTGAASAALLAVPKNLKQRAAKKTAQLKKRVAAVKQEKARLGLVVIGHVDSGKSTIMGHLLYLVGQVDTTTMSRFKHEAKQAGKSSFAYAWVLDGHAAERERGVTIDVSVNYFETKSKRFTLLDAPGHRDFVPNMISGAAQADVAILVINASGKEFERGFEKDGQTKEHAILARSLGIEQLVVAVNKLDLEEWSKEKFDSIKEELTSFLRKIGFSSSCLFFVPVCGFNGENLIERKQPLLSKWYSGPTLLQQLDELKVPERAVDKPFRLVTTDVFKDELLGTTVAGKIESGLVASGDKVLVMPFGLVASIKALRNDDNREEWSSAGENIDLGLSDIDILNLSTGLVLCDPEHPIPVVSRFRAKLMTLDLSKLLPKGAGVLLHIHNLVVPAVLTRLYGLYDKSSGVVVQKAPRFLSSKQTAEVLIVTEKPICLEKYADFPAMGRFTLRVESKTIAAGVVLKLFKSK